MANGNKGIGSYLPFPTFGGEKSPGIMPVQLQPSPMKFPTPRAINRRTPEPDFVETIAPLLPFATEGLLGLIRGGDAAPTAADREDYIKEDILYLGEDEERDKTTPLTKIQQAKLDAYDVYGEPDEGGADWGSILANLVVGSQMGRGAGDYADTTIALKKAARTKEATEATARATFIQDRLKRKAKTINLVNTNSAALGVPEERKGYVYEEDPEKFYVHTQDGYIEAGPEWAIRSPLGEGGRDILDTYGDPRYKELIKIQGDISEKELALAKTQDVAMDLIDSLDVAIANPGMAGTTYVAEIASFVNDMATNYDQLTASFKTRWEKDFIDEETGKQAKNIRNALDSGTFNADGQWTGDKDSLIASLNTLVDSTVGETLGLRDKLGQISYNNVSQVAQFLQIAYQSAATAGQTGRTLSDKDLAFFLQMTGYGASQVPQVQKDNLLRFIDSNISGLDLQVGIALGINGMPRFIQGQVPEGGDRYTSLIGMYWKPLEKNWLDFQNYRFKDYYERNKGVGRIDEWKNYSGKYYKGRGENPPPGTGIIETDTEEDADAAALREILGLN